MYFKTLLLVLSILIQSCNSTKNSTSEKGNAIAINTNSTAIIEIEGMACQEGCANVIQENLLKQDGVIEATVSFQEKKATVLFNSTKTNSDFLLKTITATKVKDYTYTIKNITLNHH